MTEETARKTSDKKSSREVQPVSYGGTINGAHTDPQPAHNTGYWGGLGAPYSLEDDAPTAGGSRLASILRGMASRIAPSAIVVGRRSVARFVIRPRLGHPLLGDRSDAAQPPP